MFRFQLICDFAKINLTHIFCGDSFTFTFKNILEPRQRLELQLHCQPRARECPHAFKVTTLEAFCSLH